VLYYKYIISPKVACDGCTDYYLMYLNVKKSDNSYDLGLNLDIIDYRTFNFRHQRIAIFNFKPYKFNDEINVNYKINSGNRFFLNSENDKQAFIRMFDTLAWHYKLNIGDNFALNDRYNENLIIKEGAMTDRLLCRVETQDDMRYIVYGGGVNFQGFD